MSSESSPGEGRVATPLTADEVERYHRDYGVVAQVRQAIPQQIQRQDSLTDQVRDLHRIAARLGMYDAADFLWKSVLDPNR